MAGMRPRMAKPMWAGHPDHVVLTRTRTSAFPTIEAFEEYMGEGVSGEQGSEEMIMVSRKEVDFLRHDRKRLSAQVAKLEATVEGFETLKDNIEELAGNNEALESSLMDSTSSVDSLHKEVQRLTQVNWDLSHRVLESSRQSQSYEVMLKAQAICIWHRTVAVKKAKNLSTISAPSSAGTKDCIGSLSRALREVSAENIKLLEEHASLQQRNCQLQDIVDGVKAVAIDEGKTVEEAKILRERVDELEKERAMMKDKMMEMEIAIQSRDMQLRDAESSVKSLKKQAGKLENVQSALEKSAMVSAFLERRFASTQRKTGVIRAFAAWRLRLKMARVARERLRVSCVLRWRQKSSCRAMNTWKTATQCRRHKRKIARWTGINSLQWAFRKLVSSVRSKRMTKASGLRSLKRARMTADKARKRSAVRMWRMHLSQFRIASKMTKISSRNSANRVFRWWKSVVQWQRSMERSAARLTHRRERQYKVAAWQTFVDAVEESQSLTLSQRLRSTIGDRGTKLLLRQRFGHAARMLAKRRLERSFNRLVANKDRARATMLLQNSLRNMEHRNSQLRCAIRTWGASAVALRARRMRRHRQDSVLLRIAHYLLNKKSASGFKMWKDAVSERRQADNRMRQVIRRMLSGRVTSTFAMWRSVVKTSALARQDQGNKANRALALWETLLSKKGSRALRQWRNYVAINRHGMSVAAVAKQRIGRRKVSMAFHSWHAVTTIGRFHAKLRRFKTREAARLRKCLVLFLQKQVAAAFAKWNLSRVQSQTGRRILNNWLNAQKTAYIRQGFEWWKNLIGIRRKARITLNSWLHRHTLRYARQGIEWWQDHMHRSNLRRLQARRALHLSVRNARLRGVRTWLRSIQATRVFARTTKVVASLSNRGVFKAFHTWLDCARALRHGRYTIERTIFKLQNLKVSKAIATWRGHRSTGRYNMNVLHRACNRIHYRKAAAAYNLWTERVRESRRIAVIIRRVCTRVIHSKVNAAMGTWCHRVAETRRLSLLLNKACSRIRFNKMIGAFTKWRAVRRTRTVVKAQEETKHAFVLNIVEKSQGKSLLWAFHVWTRHLRRAGSQRTLRTAGRNLVLRMYRRMLRDSVEQWRSCYQRRRSATKETMRLIHVSTRFTRRIHQRTVYKAYYTWCSRVTEEKRARDSKKVEAIKRIQLVRSLAQRFIFRRETAALNQWKFQTLAGRMKEQWKIAQKGRTVTALKSLRVISQSRTVPLAFNTWKMVTKQAHDLSSKVKEETLRRMSAMNRLVKKLRKANLLRGFNTLKEFALSRDSRTKMLRRTLSKCRYFALRRSVAQWRRNARPLEVSSQDLQHGETWEEKANQWKKETRSLVEVCRKLAARNESLQRTLQRRHCNEIKRECRKEREHLMWSAFFKWGKITWWSVHRKGSKTTLESSRGLTHQKTALGMQTWKANTITSQLALVRRTKHAADRALARRSSLHWALVRWRGTTVRKLLRSLKAVKVHNEAILKEMERTVEEHTGEKISREKSTPRSVASTPSRALGSSPLATPSSTMKRSAHALYTPIHQGRSPGANSLLSSTSSISKSKLAQRLYAIQ